MTTTTTRGLWCAGCGDPLEPGTALRVTDRRTGAVIHVHRGTSLREFCLRAAGPAALTTIELEDPAAARAWDIATGGRPRTTHRS